MLSHLKETDPEVYRAVIGEAYRQHSKLELIASENFVSYAVLETMGSVMTNKYAEGLPGKRYYGGCEFVDVAENLVIERTKALFGCEHVNAQPHAGAQANQAAYMALINPGDTMMGLDLSHGGHLTHGHPLNFSGKYFAVVAYGVEPGTEVIDYDKLMAKAKEVRPKLIMAGASAYPRMMHYDKFAEIAKEVGAYLVVDIAHIAGLIVAGLHPSPVPYADVVTTTVHKTLRGPRSGLIMCKEEHAAAIDKAVFPGAQGGPLMHIIAAKAVALKEAMQPEFKTYQEQVVKNAKVLAGALAAKGFRIVSGGTDTHLMLVDVKSVGLTGRKSEKRLDDVNITVNKNTIPFDTNSPMVASGVRIGTPALTTRGMKENEMEEIGILISRALNSIDNETELGEVKKAVSKICDRFPLYASRLAAYDRALGQR